MKLIIEIILVLAVSAVNCEVILDPIYENAIPAIELPHNQEILKKLYPTYQPNKQHGNTRIANGWPAYRGQFPYQAFMYMIVPPFTSFCGGTFIKYNFVLTVSKTRLKLKVHILQI